MLPVALALALAAVPMQGAEDAGEVGDSGEPWDAVEEAPRLDLTIWGGQGWVGGTGGARSEAYAAEASWRFDRLDLGMSGGLYRLDREAADGALERYSAPVLLLRVGQRFETRNGLLANFTFGVGTAKTSGWRSWFQVALGARATFGPAFVAGELAFESDEILRLALGLGVSLF
ncbi:MAG TPA: hypothetical protein VLT47_05685 [Anaeromyxobacteraceae bacterium]|nr:hypothetical protein [Anaeromyxobacteraceae bacterium]